MEEPLPVGPLDALLATVTSMSTETAVADATCRAEVGYAEHSARVWCDLQEEFYAEHREDFDAWVAAFLEFDARQ